MRDNATTTVMLDNWIHEAGRGSRRRSAGATPESDDAFAGEIVSVKKPAPRPTAQVRRP
jgi:hypothetical protein